MMSHKQTIQYVLQQVTSLLRLYVGRQMVELGQEKSTFLPQLLISLLLLPLRPLPANSLVLSSLASVRLR
jgi:hypothetical protein